MQQHPHVQVPPTGLSPRVLRDEVWVVLAVSVLASVVFAAIDLFSAPIHGQVRATFPAYPLAQQLASLAFQLAPVALV